MLTKIVESCPKRTQLYDSSIYGKNMNLLSSEVGRYDRACQISTSTETQPVAPRMSWLLRKDIIAFPLDTTSRLCYTIYWGIPVLHWRKSHQFWCIKGAGSKRLGGRLKQTPWVGVPHFLKL